MLTIMFNAYNNVYFYTMLKCFAIIVAFYIILNVCNYVITMP